MTYRVHFQPKASGWQVSNPSDKQQTGIDIFDYIARWGFDVDAKDSVGKYNGLLRNGAKIMNTDSAVCLQIHN